jgi:hypothetical protein
VKHFPEAGKRNRFLNLDKSLQKPYNSFREKTDHATRWVVEKGRRNEP